ncbi:MAG TPA: protein-tyrosine phosphatase family protein [Planctomycetota bacterium]|nr:protein-tyrosine phosphatase family protein [Planctomycetota bacterium]
MKRKRTPEAVLTMLWVAAAIYFGAKSLEPRDEDEDLDLLPIPNIPSELPGVPNFFRVSEDLLRGAQPSATGFRALKAVGVKTILNLRHYHSDRWMLDKIALDYEHVDIKSWSIYGGHVLRFLEIATDKSRTPVFIHCHDGIGRTGALCAMYRIVVQGWSRDDAIREMREAGPWEEKWFNKVVGRLDDMDVDQMRRALGLPKPKEPVKP